MNRAVSRQLLHVGALLSVVLAGCLATVGLGQPASGAGSPDDIARLIAAQLKARKGLAIHLGCSDTRLPIALARQTELTIECVDPGKQAVETARRALDEAGLYGTRIGVSQEEAKRLLFPDYSANLITASDDFVATRPGRDFKEVYRVLSPNGVAWIGQSAAAKAEQRLTRRQLEDWLREAGVSSYTIVEEQGTWARITQPQPEGWDKWTHRSHDPGNTFGSEDTLTGPAFKPHWVSDYRPGLSSAAVAIAGGRVVLASLSYDPFPERGITSWWWARTCLLSRRACRTCITSTTAPARATIVCRSSARRRCTS
jgi:hypothetical protein